MRPLPLDCGAPLKVHERYPGSRILLMCAACGWSRAYDPQRIIERLRVLRRGDAETALAAVSRQVQWPCPRCRRMRWRSVLAAPQRSS